MALHPYIMSEDIRGRAGAKRFCGCTSPEKLMELVNFVAGPDSTASLYEIIRDKQRDPVNIILDLERDFTSIEALSETSRQRAREATWEAIVKCVEALLSELFDEKVVLKPGLNCQVLESTYDGKFSRHLLIYASGMTMLMVSAIASQLNRRALALPDDDLDRSVLVWTHKGSFKSVFDPSIYSDFRSMRMAFCNKLSKATSTKLQPVLGSSDDISAHLVNVWPDVYARPEVLPALDVSRLPEELLDHPRPRRRATGGEMQTSPVQEELASPPLWQPGQMQEVREFLIQNDKIKKLLCVETLEFGQEKPQVDGSGCIFPIPHSCNVTCPYAERQHESNNLYFQYSHVDRRAVLRCHNDHCKQGHKPGGHDWFPIKLSVDESMRLALINSQSTMHSCRSLIDFGEEDIYNEREMRPYPAESKIVAVLAGMGTGKTEGAKKYLDGIPRKSRVLCISFRVALCEKLASDFDITSYNEVDKKDEEEWDAYLHEYCADRLVVQLDSLWRVSQKPYDIVLIDETLSTLLHIRSNLLKRPTAVLQRLNWFLTNARQVMLLDACLDEKPSFDFIQWLERMKGEGARWIYNSFINPMKRTAMVHLERKGGIKASDSLRDSAFNRVVFLLKGGKNVYVPTTSVTFAQQLELHLKKVYTEQELPPYVIITGKSSSDLKKKLARDMRAELDGKRLLICSPTITAGNSLKEHIFTNVVAYGCNNRDKGATVDAFLQQLFRVRNLGDTGAMDIYVYDNPGPDSFSGPFEDGELDRDLEAHINQMYPYISPDVGALATMTTANGKLEFARNSLAYCCLKGCVYMQNKSTAGFSSVLVGTLREYGISVDVKEDCFTPYDDVERGAQTANTAELRKELKKILKEDGDTLLANPECQKLLYEEELTDLNGFTGRGQDRSDVQKQQCHTYKMARNVYRVFRSAEGQMLPPKFLEVYVQAHHFEKEAVALNLQMQRMRLAVEKTSASLSRSYETGIYDLHSSEDSAVEVHYSDKHVLYRPTFLVSDLLDQLDSTWKDQVKLGKNELSFGIETAKGILLKWLQETIKDDAQYTNLLELLGIPLADDKGKRFKYWPRDIYNAFLSDSRGGKGNKRSLSAIEHIGRLCNATFAMILKKKGKENKNSKHRILSFKRYSDLQTLLKAINQSTGGAAPSCNFLSSDEEESGDGDWPSDAVSSSSLSPSPAPSQSAWTPPPDVPSELEPASP